MAAELGLPGPMGARVTAVTRGSPAEAAKLLPGDVILEIDGVKIEDDAHVINVVGQIAIGKTVPLVLFRDGKTRTGSVRVADRGEFSQ